MPLIFLGFAPYFVWFSPFFCPIFFTLSLLQILGQYGAVLSHLASSDNTLIPEHQSCQSLVSDLLDYNWGGCKSVRPLDTKITYHKISKSQKNGDFTKMAKCKTDDYRVNINNIESCRQKGQN